MNRRDLVAALAERTDSDKRTADAALQAFIDVVTDNVAGGEPVAISGFAKFARRDVPAKPRRKGRNPATGEEIWLAPKPASRSVKITPLKAFKDSVIRGKRAPAKKTTARKTSAKKTTAKRTTKKAPARRTARR
jgi:nucleoid DNA-binding protein